MEDEMKEHIQFDFIADNYFITEVIEIRNEPYESS